MAIHALVNLLVGVGWHVCWVSCSSGIIICNFAGILVSSPAAVGKVNMSVMHTARMLVWLYWSIY